MNTRYLLCLILFFASCTSESQRQKLLFAETEMEHQPDSVLRMLEQMDSPSGIFSRKDRAHYALLRVQALDKNALPITDDSLLNIALNYYSGGTPTIELAKTYYYQGCYYVDAGMTKEAIKSFTEAKNMAEKFTDYNLLGLISSRLGYLYAGQRDWDNAFRMNTFMSYYFKKIGNMKNLYLSYHEKARLFLMVSKIDSTSFYIEKAKQGFLSINDNENYERSLVLESNILLWKGDAKKAKTILKEAKQLMEDSVDILINKSLVIAYQSLREIDSAQMIVKQLLNNKKYERDLSVYYLSSQLDETEGNYQSALKTLKQAYLLQDSVYSHNLEHSTYHFVQLYNKELAEKVKAKLLNNNRTLWGGIIVLLVGLLFSFVIYRHRHNRVIAETKLRIMEAEHQRQLLQEFFEKKEFGEESHLAAFFQRQTELMKYIIDATKRNMSDSNARQRKIGGILEKYLERERWNDLKLGVDILNHGAASYLELNHGESLSENEMRICVLSLAGYSVKDVSLFLNVSEKTIYNLRSSIYRKLNAGHASSSLKILIQKLAAR